MRSHDKRKEPIVKPGDVKGDINVTPLVDVCLVLLIIFMVVTPLLQKGVDVALPETTRPEKIPENEKQLTVAIKLDGSVFVGQDWIPKNQLLAEFKKIRTDSPGKEIVVKGDKRLKYRDVREVMRLLNDAGFTKVGLITHKKDQGAASNPY
ncbi:MAG: ExbD/TolR family protein [Acidobacteriota bacterium]